MPDVPDLLGKTRRDADTALAAIGLVVGTVMPTPSERPLDTIVNTQPTAGTRVAEGSSVDLELSSGPEQVAVPQTVGKSRAEAEAALTGAGLLVGVVTAQAGNGAAGTVASASPPAGTLVNKGSAMSLTISTGPASVIVTDVVAKTRADTEAALRVSGLTIGNVTTAPSDTIASGLTLRTNPGAGATVTPGTPIDLEVSTGPERVAVPDVTGFTRSAAEAMITSFGLVLGEVKRQHSNSVPDGGVSYIEPSAGTMVLPRTPVALTVSQGPERSVLDLPLTFIVFGGALLALIWYIVIWGKDFLEAMRSPEIARGLITFLISIGTVGIAITLTVSTLVLAEGTEADKRFDRGKQVLSILIGVLGTIVGFYFGSEQNPSQAPNTVQTPAAIITTMLNDGIVGAPYTETMLQTTGLTAPLNWSVMPDLPAGLTLDATTGTIRGTPRQVPQNTQFTFTVKDGAIPAHSVTKVIPLQIKGTPAPSPSP